MSEGPPAGGDTAETGNQHGVGPLLRARGIVKRFGETVANDRVDLDIFSGEVHALLGENGAGKSTLVKILYGALQPNAGTISWKGRDIVLGDPAKARRLGIGMVFQHFSLFEALTVVENIALALADGGADAALERRVRDISGEYGLALDPTALVADLPVGVRQRIEIVRCLLQEPELIIMDEPTSVLTPQEADQLFTTLDRLVSEGRAILYISHRLEEVQRLCHNATILRRGRVVATCDPQRETAGTLARMMVGTHIHQVDSGETGTGGGDVRLSLRNLSLAADGPFSVALKDISLDVRAGEVVAVAGIAGNGQGELFDAVSGERVAETADSVVIDGVPAGRLSITARRRLDAAFVPEERLGHGAVPALTLSDNVVLTRHSTGEGLLRNGLLDAAAAIEIEERISLAFDVRKGHADPEARALSGGNLQKFVVGRELDRSPGVLVVNQPTWGVDAGAAALIRQAIIDMARAGAAVLVISQDLDEIDEIADRIAVISRGQLSDAMTKGEASRERIGLLMGGLGEGRAARADTDAA